MVKLKKAFKKAANEARAAFIPYFILGLPTIEKSIEIITEAAEYFDVLELGIPFSDPVADGPTIQEGALKALENKYSMDDFFKATKEISKKIKKPIVYMLYYNQVFGYGTENFMSNAKDAGVSGLIIPDLLPETDKQFISTAKKHDIETIFLATPVTKNKRLKMVLNYSKGFLYLTSLVGITGERDNVNNDLENLANNVKKESTLPVCVGFGVSSAQHVENISKFADGVIVGSAIVKRIINNDKPLEFIKELFEATKKK